MEETELEEGELVVLTWTMIKTSILMLLSLTLEGILLRLYLDPFMV